LTFIHKNILRVKKNCDLAYITTLLVLRIEKRIINQRGENSNCGKVKLRGCKKTKALWVVQENHWKEIKGSQN